MMFNHFYGKKILHHIGTILFIGSLVSCGGGGGTSNSPNTVPTNSSTANSSLISSSATSSVAPAFLMGGAIQGTPLNISTLVTTIAGTYYRADGFGTAARFSQPTGIVRQGTELYITDKFTHTIRKLEIPNNKVTTFNLDNSFVLNGGFNEPLGITSDGISLFVADRIAAKIYSVDITTGTVKFIAGSIYGDKDGVGSSASFESPQEITTDGSNLYITDMGTIRKIVIATGEVTTLAGMSRKFDSIDGIGKSARFAGPNGITTDGTYLYVTESTTVRKVSIASGEVTTIAGSPDAPGSEDGTGTAARFKSARGISTDGANLYVAEQNVIRKLELANMVVTTLAGNHSTAGYIDGVGIAAGFYSLGGIANDGISIYVGDGTAVRKITAATGEVKTISGRAYLTYDGQGKNASFDTPSGITSDGSYLYLADLGHNAIRRLALSSGDVTTFAGTPYTYGSQDGESQLATFNRPVDITTDGNDLYVSDMLNHAIRKISIASGTVSTLVGKPNNPGSEDGIGTLARLYYPAAITTDNTSLYVADSGNHTIRKIVLATGAVTTLAGTATSNGPSDTRSITDGIGATASFSSPKGITVSGENLYLTDDKTIRKIFIKTGEVTTIAGKAGVGESIDGTGLSARFTSPSGITSDGTNLYVKDGNTIRKIVITTKVVTTIAGTDGMTGDTDGVGNEARFSSFDDAITTNGFDLFVTDGQYGLIRKIH